jgi:hypothetical protein
MGLASTSVRHAAVATSARTRCVLRVTQEQGWFPLSVSTHVIGDAGHAT